MKSKIDFIPVGDRVIVKPDTEQEQTASGIIVVRSGVNDEAPGCGEIWALGEGGTFPDCPNPSKFFSIGDIVYFNKYAGEDFIFKIDGEEVELKSLRIDAIIGKVKNGK